MNLLQSLSNIITSIPKSVSAYLQQNQANQNLYNAANTAMQQDIARGAYQTPQMLDQRATSSGNTQTALTQIRDLMGTQDPGSPIDQVQKTMGTSPTQKTQQYLDQQNTQPQGYWDVKGQRFDTRDAALQYINDMNAKINAANEAAIKKTMQDQGFTSEADIQKYLKEHPFALDDAWMKTATESINTQLDPYYKEKLNNYLSDVKTNKDRAMGDEQTFLNELDRQQKVYFKDDAAKYQEIKRNALEGQTDIGLLGTGEGQRQLNLQDRSHNLNVQNYLDTNKYKTEQEKTSTNRYLQDLETNSTRFQTDLGRQRKYDFESMMLGRKQEEYDRYKAGLDKKFSSYIPSSVSAYLS